MERKKTFEVEETLKEGWRICCKLFRILIQALLAGTVQDKDFNLQSEGAA